MEILLKEDIGGKTLSIQTGKVAKEASGSALVQYGDTMVLVTVVSVEEEKSSDFLPLQVEYRKKFMRPGESRATISAAKSDVPAKRKPSPRA